MTETVLVGEAVAGQAAQARAQLEALINNVNKQTIDVAELLHKVKSNFFYQPTFDTWKDYIKSLNIKERKAQYLTKIVETFTACGIERAQYEPLGIARLREITSLDPNASWTNPETGEIVSNAHFITTFVEKGEEIEIETLKQHVRTLKGFTGENDIVWRNFPFTRLVAENTIDPAIALAKANIGSVSKDEEGFSKDASDSACVEVWAIEYLNDAANNPMNQTVQTEPVASDEPTDASWEDFDK